MHKKILFSLIVLVSILVFNLESNAQLAINLDFSSFSTGAPADGNAILGGANLSDAQTVIEAAATYWENAFVNSSSSIAWSTNAGGLLTQDIEVTWGAETGPTLASGGTGWFSSDGRWAGNASLNWDNDGTSSFYVDTTPTNTTEWSKSSERDLSFGVPVNVERVQYAATNSVIQDNSDMFSVAVHEIGHALGFLGSFPSFLADASGDNDIDITSGPLSGAAIPVNGGHTNFQLTSPAGGDFPYDPGGGGFFPPFDYDPNVMGPVINDGIRKLLTEADIAIVADFLEFDMNTVNFNPSVAAVPEPGSLAVLGMVGLLFVNRRRRAN